jgi:hypothetical protein
LQLGLTAGRVQDFRRGHTPSEVREGAVREIGLTGVIKSFIRTRTISNAGELRCDLLTDIEVPSKETNIGVKD